MLQRAKNLWFLPSNNWSQFESQIKQKTFAEENENKLSHTTFLPCVIVDDGVVVIFVSLVVTENVAVVADGVILID